MFAERSSCPRLSVGVVLVRDGRIISTGYNGAPPGMAHCTEVGCDMGEGCKRAIHAEVNAIAWAARNGVSTYGATMFSTRAPCVACAQVALAAGIVQIHYDVLYRDAGGLQLMEAALGEDAVVGPRNAHV
jgi:dCMP deaminase